jgi:hypothetical protein
MPITSTELEQPAAATDMSHGPRHRRLATTPEWLLRVSIESLLIVLSILLALAVDQWREGRNNQELAQQSLQIFAQEIEQNLAMMNDLVPYHVGLQQVVAEMAEQPDRSVDVHSIVEGLQPTALLNTAWETALATGAFRHMDVSTVSRLSRVYGLQQRFRDQTTIGRPELFVASAATPDQRLQQMQQALRYLTAVVRAEQELRGIYVLALDEIDPLAEFRTEETTTPGDTLRP